MNRRQLLPLLGSSVLLAGCSGQSVTRRFRVTATAVDAFGDKFEGSTVMEISYSRVTGSVIGSGGAATLKGEALILDLPDKQTVYVLPWFLNHHGSVSQVYENGILRTLQITGGVGVIPDDGFEKLRVAQGRLAFRGPFIEGKNYLPLFVAFENEKSPKTIYEVDPFNIKAHFSGVKLESFDIEFTDAPVTHKLKQRLPWLDKPGPHFNSDPPGQLRPVSQLPLSYKMSREKFFASGN